MLFLRIPLATALLLAAGPAAAVEVSVGVAPREVEIGDHAALQIYVTRDDGERITQISLLDPVSPEAQALAEISLTLGGDLLVREVDTWETFALVGQPTRSMEGLGEGRTRETWTVTLAAFETGEVSLPSVTVRWVGPDDAEDQVQSDTGTVTIASVMPPGETPAQPRDPHGPYELPEPLRLWPFLVMAAALPLAALGWWLWRRPRPTEATVRPTEPARPPHEVALADLEALECANLIAERQHRAFFYALTDIVRVYFEREFRIGAPEMTSTELLASLRERDFPAELCRQFEGWISACDLVKYASQRPREEHCRTAITLARAIITSAHHHFLAVQREGVQRIAAAIESMDESVEAGELAAVGGEPREGAP